MSYQLFHDYFPEIAERETRGILLQEPHRFTDIPPGNYGFLEAFCNEPGCACRRVMWMVHREQQPNPVAVIAYGWGSARFYTNWFGQADPDIIKEMQGPILNMASPQSPYAPAILEMMKLLVLNDKHYINRVKNHYTLFRNKIDTEPRLQA